MICVALQESNVSNCLEILESVELAEIRIDLAHLSKEDVVTIFSESNSQLIATCRPDNYSDEERMDLLKVAISSGAAFVDIEIESKPEFTKELVAFAKQFNTTVIISYHNFEQTPLSAELAEIIKTCFDLGADIAKIATMVTSNQDNARLLSLYDTEKKIVVLGMGQLGKITRLMAPYLGSPFTFASLDEASATAPGQITAFRLKQLLEQISLL